MMFMWYQGGRKVFSVTAHRSGKMTKSRLAEAYALTGDADYLLKVVVPDLKDLSVLVNDVLLPHETVARVRSSIVLDRLKETARLPLRSLARGGGG
jgi:DNA-binding Lrp family transcriptional regulator